MSLRIWEAFFGVGFIVLLKPKISESPPPKMLKDVICIAWVTPAQNEIAFLLHYDLRKLTFQPSTIGAIIHIELN